MDGMHLEIACKILEWIKTWSVHAIKYDHLIQITQSKEEL